MVKLKDQIIDKMKEEKKHMVEAIQAEKRNFMTLKEKGRGKDELIKQIQNEYGETKKKYSELKQKMEQSDTIISKIYEELPDRLFKMSTNYLRTGKIQDSKSYNYGDGSDQNEMQLLEFQLKKLKSRILCPKCEENDRNTSLK
jgi:chromosome segregation ATPase